MAYKFSKGNRGLGDIQFEDDSDTGFDFEQNYIGFDTDGSTSMVLSGSRVGIGTTTPDYRLQVAGNIGVNQYIYHNGDANTWINFTDNRIRLNAGGNNFIDCEDPGNAPHYVRINNGGNNIDFIIKDNSNNTYFTADASTARIGLGGAASPSTLLHLDGADPTITFSEGGTEKGTIGINSSDNILIENKTINKHIVFKVNDQGVVKEGLRLDGAVPEVVVNQTSDSLVDFRVESDNQTHMFFVDGSQDMIGVKTDTPLVTFDVNGEVRNNGGVYRKLRDVGSTGNILQTDYMIRGIQNNSMVLTLPSKSNNSGQILIIKDMLGNAGSPNNKTITINAASNETIDGTSNYVINTNRGSVTLMCDGINGWMIIGKYSG